MTEEPHGKTSIGTLRKTYGEGFAPEFRSDDRLSSLLESTGTTSLAEYLEHSKRGMRIVGTSSDVTNTIVSHTTMLFETALKNLAKK
jgi:hypothetical protein